ncbi:MAG: cyclic pyranopterin monophosphate synthase MoaC, partial [Planctomycetota bacterium]
MVDVSDKPVTVREAVASAVIRMKPDVLASLVGGELPKGDALATARLAATLAAKRTDEWIPLAHTIPLTHVAV